MQTESPFMPVSSVKQFYQKLFSPSTLLHYLAKIKMFSDKFAL